VTKILRNLKLRFGCRHILVKIYSKKVKVLGDQNQYIFEQRKFANSLRIYFEEPVTLKVIEEVFII
jgi:predicted component of viral defense system (DUF524 family)